MTCKEFRKDAWALTRVILRVLALVFAAVILTALWVPPAILLLEAPFRWWGLSP